MNKFEHVQGEAVTVVLTGEARAGPVPFTKGARTGVVSFTNSP